MRITKSLAVGLVFLGGGALVTGACGGDETGDDSPGGAGGAATGGAASTGGKSSTGGSASCDSDCEYGSECVAGACKSLCDDGEVYCDGGCVDPKTSELFCGATAGCDAGNGPTDKVPLPMGGADGGGGAPSAEGSSGVHCGTGQQCLSGLCEYTQLIPGSTAVVRRNGFSVQCRFWEGRLCVEPFIQIPLAAVVGPADSGPGGAPSDASACIADDTTLRPIWWDDDAAAQAPTFCWIATGSSAFVQAIESEEDTTEEYCGWMYGSVFSGSGQTCQGPDARNYSEVAVPTLEENLLWSFDGMEFCRTGSFSQYECEW